MQSRGGLGLKNVEITEKNGKVISIAQVDGDETELLLITEQGKILRTPTEDIRTIGRATQGVRLMDLEEGDRLVSVALVDKDDERAAGRGGAGSARAAARRADVAIAQADASAEEDEMARYRRRAVLVFVATIAAPGAHRGRLFAARRSSSC